MRDIRTTRNYRTYERKTLELKTNRRKGFYYEDLLEGNYYIIQPSVITSLNFTPLTLRNTDVLSFTFRISSVGIKVVLKGDYSEVNYNTQDKMLYVVYEDSKSVGFMVDIPKGVNTYIEIRSSEEKVSLWKDGVHISTEYRSGTGYLIVDTIPNPSEVFYITLGYQSSWAIVSTIPELDLEDYVSNNTLTYNGETPLISDFRKVYYEIS